MKEKWAGKIFLISIDTLRADHLGCYGYQKPVSPNIDAMAKESVLYPNAFAPSSYTVPVHAALLTGLYPLNHNLGLKQAKGRIDADRTIFLQEILRGEGYVTAAFVSSLVLRRHWGLDWGFDLYDDQMTAKEPNRPHELIRGGRETTNAVLEWAKQHKKDNFLLWAHYFDVHGPYSSEGPFGPADYGDAPQILERVPDGQPGGIPEYQLLGIKRDETGNVLDYRKDLRFYLAGYDNGIRFQDAVIGDLIEGLKDEGIYADSLIILMADHGEALGEGGVYFFHGLTVTPEQSRVPLIIKPPVASRKPKVCEAPVSTVDIMPTILDWIGFPWERLGIDGVSLFAPKIDRIILSENEWQRAVISGDYYLLREKDTVFDGFFYYFDSQALCRGTKLLDYKEGKEIDPDPQGPAGELIKYSELLRILVDPKEKWIKVKDGELAKKDEAIAEKENIILEKDAERERIIAFKEKEIGIRDEQLANCRARLKELENELASVYGSKSWRLTYPLRWVSARIKGISE